MDNPTKDKQFYDATDIMAIYGCGLDKARSIIRSIKYCTGDKLGIAGKVLVTEHDAWQQAVNIKI